MSKILIIEATFYKAIAAKLRQGAEAALKEQNIEYETESVPGALEIPAALNFALGSPGNYKAYIVLGCVIRGETSHYDIVCNESARSIYNLVIRHKLALGNGILTVENKRQAMERADPTRKNKGGDAARAALHMLAMKKLYKQGKIKK